MPRCRSRLVAVAAVVCAAACGDRVEPSSPGVPTMSADQAAGASCAFNAFNPLVSRYFATVTERKAVKALIDGMQAAGPFTTTAQDDGFSALAYIAASVDAGNPDSSDANDLSNGLLACMYADTAALPATFPENFLPATDPNAAGAYQVRGSAADGLTSPVYNRPYTAPFSVIAPPSGSDWAGVLHSDPAPRRLLVYGRPGSNPYSYDWKVVPRNTVFDPQVVVGVCADASASPTAMLNEEHVGLLTFALIDPGLLDLTTCSRQVALERPFAPARLAGRWLGNLFSVPSAWALSGGIGGSTGGIRSEFGTLTLFGVAVSVVQQPPTNVTVCATPPCGTGFSIQVLATSATPAGTFTVGGTTLHLTGVNNNGTPTEVYQCTGGTCTTDPVATTTNAGLATFSGLFVTKTGALRLVVGNGTVTGRDAISVGSATTDKFNVNPF
jgi:hypothetical protein